MTDTYKDTLAREQAQFDKKCAEAQAKRDYYNGIGPKRLAEQLLQKLELKDHKSRAAMIERLESQVFTLDSVFYTELHNAGFGQTTALSQDQLKTALSAQKQCRQLFDTLKPLPSEKSGKPNKEP